MTEAIDKDVFDASPRPLVERIARIEGQSNFLSLLAGIEAGPDTTEDMAALAISRNHGAIPEVLETQVAQSTLHRLPLMSMVFAAIRDEFRPKRKEYPWIQGAIADAYLMTRTGSCKPLGVRAKHFRVDVGAYGAIRKIAWQIFLTWIDKAEREYRRAMRQPRETGTKSETPLDRHTMSEGDTFKERSAFGSYLRAPLANSDDPADEDDPTPSDTGGVGMRNRLGWDDRNAKAGPVIKTLPVQRTADHADEINRGSRLGHKRPATNSKPGAGHAD